MYEDIVRITTDLADTHCRGRLIATGGGGYAVWQVVPRAWTLVWAGLTGQEAGDDIPRSWIERWQGESPYLLPDRLRDDPAAYPGVPRRGEVEALNRRALEALRRNALPLLRGWGLEY
jgi:acetoin utilization protein AcuC